MWTQTVSFYQQQIYRKFCESVDLSVIHYLFKWLHTIDQNTIKLVKLFVSLSWKLESASIQALFSKTRKSHNRKLNSDQVGRSAYVRRMELKFTTNDRGFGEWGEAATDDDRENEWELTQPLLWHASNSHSPSIMQKKNRAYAGVMVWVGSVIKYELQAESK